MTGALTVLDEDAIRRIVTDVIRTELMAGLEEVFKEPETSAADELLSAAEVAKFLSINTRDLRRLVLDGIIPHGIALGPRRLRWRRSTIVQALARLEAEAAKSARSNLTRSRSDRSVSGVKKTSGDQP